jgi:hypothetical protein
MDLFELLYMAGQRLLTSDGMDEPPIGADQRHITSDSKHKVDTIVYRVLETQG